MEIEEFQEAVRKDDFSIGDSFWIDNWEFEVVNRKAIVSVDNEAVFKWELTREEFIQAIRDNHPEIKNPEEFFEKHKDDILHDFTKAFDVLVGECGVTYGLIIGDVVDEVVSQRTRAGDDRK